MVEKIRLPNFHVTICFFFRFWIHDMYNIYVLIYIMSVIVMKTFHELMGNAFIASPAKSGRITRNKSKVMGCGCINLSRGLKVFSHIPGTNLILFHPWNIYFPPSHLQSPVFERLSPNEQVKKLERTILDDYRRKISESTTSLISPRLSVALN